MSGRTATTRAALGAAALSALMLITPAALAASPLAASPPAGFVASSVDGDDIAGEWIVTLASWIQADRAASALASQHLGELGFVFTEVLNGFLFLGTEDQARRLAAHPHVRTVVPNQLVEATAQTTATGVVRIGADTLGGTAQGSGVKVAVLDTGVDLDHPDLVANLDVPRGKNCISSGPPEDDNGHGTHVAGIVAATDNTIGSVGVAPGAAVVPVKVLDRRGSGSYATLICGIDHVVADGTIRIVNMSLGGRGTAGSCTDGSLRQAICTAHSAGVSFFVAAGNSSRDASRDSPAQYPETIAVSALEDFDGTPASDRFASFSNFGSVVNLIAPGVSILSTTLGGGTGLASGTSMSTPHAAGVGALALAAQPGLTPSGLAALLAQTGECPNGTEAGTDASCSGQGLWAGDPDGIAEPLVNAPRAAGVSGGGGVVTPPGDASPTVEIQRPSSGATVDGTQAVVVAADDAEDAPGTLVVEFRVDGGPWQALSYNSRHGMYRTRWDTTTVPNGSRTLEARAVDSAANETLSLSVVVTVSN